MEGNCALSAPTGRTAVRRPRTTRNPCGGWTGGSSTTKACPPAVTTAVAKSRVPMGRLKMNRMVSSEVLVKWAGQQAEQARKEFEGQPKISKPELAAYTIG